MLLSVMDAKRTRRYQMVQFADMLEHLIPRGKVTNFIADRNRFILDMQSITAENGTKQPESFFKLVKQYDNGLFLIMTIIWEIRHTLLEVKAGTKCDKAVTDDRGEMQIRVIKKAEKYKLVSLPKGHWAVGEYCDLIANFMKQEGHNFMNRQLLLDCLRLPVLFAERDYEEIQQLYTTYLNLYMEILRSFWTEAKPLIETMLGIKQFFGQYDSELDGMRPTLLVANFPVAALLETRNREKLNIFLGTVNGKRFYSETIWYAILPNMTAEGEEKERQIRERFLANRYQYRYPTNQVEEITLLIELLAEHRIQTFLSVAQGEEQTFRAFREKGLDALEKTLEPLEKIPVKDYLIPCYPNFTVIPKEEACLVVGMELRFDDLQETIEVQGEKRLWLDGIGVEASYVAAGIVAACQCPLFLEKYYRNSVYKELPGVGYCFTEADHASRTTVDMVCETIEMSGEKTAEAIRRSRGILFGQRNGKMMILTDRAFSYGVNHPVLISMIQTMNYIERVIQYETQDFKKNLILQFFQQRPDSIISKWNSREKDMVNPILREEESLAYEIEENDRQCTFTIRFRDSELIRRETVPIFREEMHTEKR